MADSIQFMRGNKDTIPALPDGAPGWCLDEKALYVGHPEGNQKVGGAEVYQRLADLETLVQNMGLAMENMVSHSAVETQTALDENADLAAVIGAFNALLTAMQASGVMEQAAAEEIEE